MVFLIGYEGRRSPHSPLSWGAAALREGDLVVNSASRVGQHLSNEELSDLCARGSLTLLPEDLPLETFDRNDGPVVLEATNDAVSFLKLTDAIQPEYVLRAVSAEAVQYFVFRSWSAFNTVRSDVVLRICRDILDDRVEANDRTKRIEMGLVLNAHHGGLNALRAWYAEGDKRFAFRLAKASLRSDQEKEQFRQVYDALQRSTR